MIDISIFSKQHMNILYINCILVVVVHGKEYFIFSLMLILKATFDVSAQSKDLEEFIKQIFVAYCCEFE
jgi:hypothetical protein